MSLSWTFPYPSQRMPVFARNVVATSQPLAAQAGLQMLARGGNAVDAALAAAITLTVVEPTSNGIGSDAFAIIWDGKELHGLNGSGRSPRAWSPARFSGRTRMPELGWDTVTVPGAVDAWASLSRRFGKLPFADLFEPAIRYATDGFIVSPITAAKWSAAPELYADFPDFAPAFLPGGRAPLAGEHVPAPGDGRHPEDHCRDRRGILLPRTACRENRLPCRRDRRRHDPGGSRRTPLGMGENPFPGLAGGHAARTSPQRTGPHRPYRPGHPEASRHRPISRRLRGQPSPPDRGDEDGLCHRQAANRRPGLDEGTARLASRSDLFWKRRPAPSGWTVRNSPLLRSLPTAGRSI